MLLWEPFKGILLKRFACNRIRWPIIDTEDNPIYIKMRIRKREKLNFEYWKIEVYIKSGRKILTRAGSRWSTEQAFPAPAAEESITIRLRFWVTPRKLISPVTRSSLISWPTPSSLANEMRRFNGSRISFESRAGFFESHSLTLHVSSAGGSTTKWCQFHVPEYLECLPRTWIFFKLLGYLDTRLFTVIISSYLYFPYYSIYKSVNVKPIKK